MQTSRTPAVPTIRHTAGVLVIGAGGGGLRAAIAARTAGADVLVVAKRARTDAHTVLAAGGVNAALGTVDPEDTPHTHAHDTLREGYWLGDPRLATALAEEAPAAVLELVSWGARLETGDDGRLLQRYFGAHRYRRTCFAGDYTGRELQRVLVERSRAVGVRHLDGIRVTDLLVAGGECFGAYGFDGETGDRHVLYADAVVLATGGHTRLWRRSSSRRDENTGDGFAMALRAGCRLADLELVQFHPTGMTWPEEVAGTLVTEAVRGEGGILLNAEGERFMERYDPQRLELSTRDRVALANYTEIRAGRGTASGGVLLDVTHLDRILVRSRLPRMVRQFLDHQMLDITARPMEVSPTAHYSMGGVVVSPDAHETDVSGLFAVGEIAAGLHGANRLGGNSLSELLVFGRHAGTAAAARSAGLRVALREPTAVRAAAARADEVEARRGDEYARPLQRAVRDGLWAGAGVVRDEAGLRDTLEQLDQIAAQALHLDVRHDVAGWHDLSLALDLDDMLLSARATVLGALERRETRGAHTRADHPDPGHAENIEVRLTGDELVLEHVRALADPAWWGRIPRPSSRSPGACSSSPLRLRPGRRRGPRGSGRGRRGPPRRSRGARAPRSPRPAARRRPRRGRPASATAPP
jgi:succinate dehydrogenase / fumarate reductase flavoprotein subunit